MFGRIAHRYDFLNHFLSASIDRRWRRLAVRKVQELTMRPRLCLDVCSGTGDLAGALYRRLRCGVIACDFSHPMLVRAAAKFRGLPLSNVEADALSLPFPDATFDALTVAFGLRNLEDPVRGLREMRRVLKRGGALVILEFSRPRVPVLRHAFAFYFRNVLPKLGALISGHATAYQYLPESVGKFLTQQELLELLWSSGFTESEYRNLSGGIAALHWARNGR
jgi:demethylmenaquinone methyltransferase/2-methoxy-6-polyprenyl-1,4-benzoquinol methylase